VTRSREDSGVRLTDRISLGVLTRLFPRDLVDEVIAEAGRREQRSRSLPAHVVFYFVLAMALFAEDGYEEVLRRLVGGLRFLRGWSRDWKVPTTSAISQARVRLEEEPLKRMFERVAVPIATSGTAGAWFRQFRVMAIDGVVFDAPDTPENNAVFDHSNSGVKESAFPAVRVVGLAECGTRAMVGAVIGAGRTGERTLAPELLPRLEPDMLIIADRGFHGYDLWTGCLQAGAQVLFRATAQLNLPVIETYPDGSYRTVLIKRSIQRQVRQRARRHGDGPDGDLGVLEQNGIPARVIEYSIPNRDNPDEIICLLTSIMDWQLAPAHELAALYHQRWEFELALREIEMHQLHHRRVLRSKSPEMVRQELWGIFLAHYAIRHLIHEAAEPIDLDTDRISFLRTLNIVRRQVTSQADFPP
jgi:Insertion element 4 transposase N-terminal/Transposase DDE domain